MAATAGIWNHAQGSSPILAKPQSSTASGGGTGTAGTIGANDFLTLLVTELQNQDPTAQTDPNEYVNQLVAVNSLEQLIDINQTLNSAAGSGGGTGSGSTGKSVPLSGVSDTQPSSAPAATMLPSRTGAVSAKTAAGNLDIPGINPAAQRVATALGGRSH